jgi:hypothetical protein
VVLEKPEQEPDLEELKNQRKTIHRSADVITKLTIRLEKRDRELERQNSLIRTLRLALLFVSSGLFISLMKLALRG